MGHPRLYIKKSFQRICDLYLEEYGQKWEDPDPPIPRGDATAKENISI